MRNLAACYNEHAVKVSNSYCSSQRSIISPRTIPSVQTSVAFTYKVALLTQKQLFVTITWCSKLIYQGFFLQFSDKMSTSIKMISADLYQMNKMKGNHGFESSGSRIRVIWDLSGARFNMGPVPISRFYIVVLVDSQIALLLGDMNDDPIIKNLKIESNIAKFSLISQCENFSGYTQISSRARFCEAGVEHEVTVRCCPDDEGQRNLVLLISIDAKRVVKVKRLRWNFRGNHVIFIDGVVVDVMWDLYSWLFDRKPTPTPGTLGVGVSGGRCGMVMFRKRSGLDSRLWLDEEEKGENGSVRNGFSLLICASKNPG